MTVLGEGEDLEEGEHVTFVDVITKVEVKWSNRPPKRQYMVVTLGNRRPKVTATFFNVKYLKNSLTEGLRVMLSGEVGYFRGTLQLTHPAFLILHASGKVTGSKSLKTIATAAGALRRRGALGVRAGVLPDLFREQEGADVGDLRVCASGARRP